MHYEHRQRTNDRTIYTIFTHSLSPGVTYTNNVHAHVTYTHNQNELQVTNYPLHSGYAAVCAHTMQPRKPHRIESLKCLYERVCVYSNILVYRKHIQTN